MTTIARDPSESASRQALRGQLIADRFQFPVAVEFQPAFLLDAPHAFTTTDIVRRRLWLSRSVVPFTLDLTEEPEQVVFQALELLKAHDRLESGEPVVVVANVTTSNGYSNAIQVRTIE